jgi:hypothetical protein
MKSFLHLLTVAACTSTLLLSCKTAYQSGQTPDDVYYSPAREIKEETRTESEEVTRVDREEYYCDRYVRMKVRNRNRWSEFDDYYRDPYAYTYRGSYCSCNFNPRLYWGSYYNPYAPKVVVSQQAPIYNRPRTYNLQVFDKPKAVPPVVVNADAKPTYSAPQRDRTSETGSTLRDVFSSGSSSSSSSKPSSSSGSSSSGSGSKNNGNAPVRKF